MTVSVRVNDADSGVAPARRTLRLRAVGLLSAPCGLELALVGENGAVGSALDRALRVAMAEPSFEALERWLDVSFDVVPCADDTHGFASEPGSLRLRVVDRTAGMPSLTLHLPPRELASLPPVPEEVAEDFDIRLAPLPALCRVARLALSDDELASLTPGAVLLLPETFGGAWPAWLEARGVEAEALLDAEAATLVVASGWLPGPDDDDARPSRQAPTEDAPHRVDVVLASRVPWDPVAALGGGGPTRVELPAALADCRFRCLIDGLERFVGRIAPIGDGHGFFVLEKDA